VASASGRGGQQHIPRPSSFSPGAPAPWTGISPDRRRLTLDTVRARLSALPPAADAVSRAVGSRAAAVLVPLFEEDGEVYVVLIKRPDWMPSHRGEIAFPGGKFEPAVDADLRAAALREAEEEVGLAPYDVEIVAQLDGIGTVASRFTITPFVGFLRGRTELTPDPNEVDRILEVPLSELLADDVYREERWKTLLSDEFGVHFYELEDETVWGATARILTGFLAHLVAD
jgi:8-oxo-dGTP pyrophosphatase MutT (NUDIX family)